MKRERTKDYDVFRLADSISVVERKSGAAVVSFVIPCEETRKALIKMLADPVKGATVENTETPETAVEPTTTEKPATKKASTKKSKK